jgi:membrane-bound ClpP family serine protease
VWVEGEVWQAAAEDPEKPIPEGTRVRVVAVEGLRLTVKPEERGAAASGTRLDDKGLPPS